MRLSDQVDRDRDQRESDRRLRVRAGVEAGGQHLDQDVGGQADREGGERPGGGERVVGGERAMLEQAADDRLGGDDQRGGGGQGEEQRELEPLFWIPSRRARRRRRAGARWSAAARCRGRCRSGRAAAGSAGRHNRCRRPSLRAGSGAASVVETTRLICIAPAPAAAGRSA